VKLFFGGGGSSSSVVEAKEWTTYPGFFAKGGLDIMTSFLLDSILEEDPEKSSSPRLKKGICSDKTKRVMDFCCGSGVIGYALRNALEKEKRKKKTKKKVKLTMLDADAVALEAAKQNFSSLVSGNDDVNDDENNIEYLLSDGFPQKTTTKPCELILTNPPVHYNAKPDFRVLGHMLTELPNVLKKEKKGGACFCVCQRYVPLESVAQYYNNKTKTKTIIDLKIHAKNDRFCVWKIVCKAKSDS
jgi:16S rRNA G1207 methylase RsmC